MHIRTDNNGYWIIHNQHSQSFAIIIYLILKHLCIGSWTELVLVSLGTKHRQAMVAHIPSKGDIICIRKYLYCAKKNLLHQEIFLQLDIFVDKIFFACICILETFDCFNLGLVIACNCICIFACIFISFITMWLF